MRVFDRLRALRAFENQHLRFLRTGGKHDLIVEIGYQQGRGKPLTLKQLSLLDVGSIATIQRRLRGLKKLGLVQHRRVAGDRRAVELTLSPKCLRVFARYESLMASKSPGRGAVPGDGGRRHVCGLCDSDAGRRNLLVTYLAQGLKQGDKCLLVAPAVIQKEILAALPDRRKAPRHLIVSEGYDSADAQVAFLKRVAREAKQAGQTMRLAADMSWALVKNLRIDSILDVEKRLDTLARKVRLTGLCVYDMRQFSGSDFLHAVKCHRAHAHYPIALG